MAEGEGNRIRKDPQERLPEAAPPLPRFYGHLGSNNPPAKIEWPELVNSTAEEAEKKIKEEMPHLLIQVVPAGSFVIMDFNENRARVFLDSSGKVSKAPRIG
ncbi:hypothetical protein MLD38_040937 [Melastoma candidum]|nr:hypothetical protein MLD38_040937 [Melastoma candidum]